MSFLTFLLRSGLVATLAIAGIAKLNDPTGSREAVINFGVPRQFAGALARLLPIIELVIALGLLFKTTVWLSAWAALVLLTIFMIAVGINLILGRTHDCHCFGQLHSKPIGWATFVKNIVFTGGAAMLLVQLNTQPYRSVSYADAFSSLTNSQAQIFVVIGLMALCVLAYAQMHAGIPEGGSIKVQGLPLNAPAPPFELAAYDGGSKSLGHFLNEGKPLMLLFTNPQCGPCVNLFSEIKDWQQLHRDQLTITLISRGTIKQNFVTVARNGLGQVLLQEQTEVADVYGATVTPSAVIVDSEGKIASSVAAGAREIRQLLESAVGV